jgi:hypothetical protein
MMNGFAHSCVMAGAIARITPCGNVTEFSIPTHNSRPIAIVPEPGGEAMWFTEEAGNKVGRIDMDGNIEEFSVPGNMWFTEMHVDKVGKLVTSAPFARKNQVRRLADVSIWFQPCEAAFRRFSDCHHCG